MYTWDILEPQIFDLFIPDTGSPYENEASQKKAYQFTCNLQVRKQINGVSSDPMTLTHVVLRCIVQEYTVVESEGGIQYVFLQQRDSFVPH